eukprot:2486181-Pleurochrysis_carterae.AAC.10
MHTAASEAAQQAAPLLHEPYSWQSWSWDDPIQILQPPEFSRHAGHCRWGVLTLPVTTPSVPARNSSICLRAAGDLVCDTVASQGYWPECADLPEMFSRFASSGDLIIDAGANIGACSLHMLLATNAAVVAFEPGAANLFHASMTFRMLPNNSSIRSRITLYPLALGSENKSETLNAAIGNAGHSVVGKKPGAFAPRGHEPPETIVVRMLDDVLWPRGQRWMRPPTVGLLKLDVEGYECLALRGMRALLAARAIRSIKTEVFEYSLRAQGCSAVELQHMLKQAGFQLYLSMPHATELQFNPNSVYSEAPYNLYCVLEASSRRDETDSTDTRARHLRRAIAMTHRLRE